MRQMMGWPHYLQWRFRLFMAHHGRSVSVGGFMAVVLLFTLWKFAGFLHVLHETDFEEPGTKHITRLPSVVVVEEHHEVLKYWYEAIHKGLLKNQGLTLLHIDAHSDMSNPQLLNMEDFPHFRMPKDYEEVRTLMQSNDVFIQGMIMTGVLNRTIWVWPSWDHESHDEDYEQIVFEMGTTSVKSDIGITQGICTCHSSINKKERKCTYEDRDALEVEKEIPEADCHIKRKIYFEEVRDTVAMELLQEGNWLRPAEHLLLDIDEDFFGVEEAMKIFYEVGFKWKFIQALDSDLSITFCPQTRKTEQEANSLMAQILKVFINCNLKRKGCENIQQKIQEIIMSFTIKAYFADKNQIFCAKYEYITLKLLNKILEAIVDLTVPQLKLLLDVGFCRATTLKTFTQEAEFHVCHGFTLPNETVVTLHTPTFEEVDSQMNFLRNLVTHSKIPTPKLTTVCRSVRDGYTPKRLFHKIEAGVLKITSQIYEGINYDLLFDEDLLGGQKGWIGRHRA